MLRKTLLYGLSLLLGGVNVAFAQSFTGAINGTVADPTGAAVPSAKVVAIEERSDVSTATASDTQGAYSLPSLRPGFYRLEVEAAGFRHLVRSGIEVRVNDR